uniref:Pannexin n=1 Tax=Petromyzon marinus TaxID=7757 RepID=A0AAJ7UCM1_PETMA|nr:pannexin-3-like isoform X1 [Petromyzon marinus]XP_032833831.1 pannexin-3-like isoform X1 [Petromyzon marinus]
MSIAAAAAEYIFSDSLLKDSADARFKGLRLELPADRLLKFITVGLPLMLISLAFAQEISIGTQISCFPPANFSWRQAIYADAFCWASLLHHGTEPDGTPHQQSLWIHKMFPYALLLIAVSMYVPALFWRFAMVPLLSSDLVFIMEELDKSYNRSVRLAQHIVQRCPRSGDANNLFYDEVDRARRENYFEFPLLEKYLACKRDTRELLWRYVARNLLVLLLMLLSCLYLGFYHAVASVLDEFSCNIKTGLLANDSLIPGLIQCKLTSVRVFYVLSLINISVYALASALVFYNVARLWRPNQSFLDVYEMLPSFEVLGGRGAGASRAGACRCLPSDLSVILLFLGANVHELKSYKRLLVFRSVRPVPSAYDVDTLVDTMTILAGFEMSRRGGGENAGGPGSSEVDGARVAKDAKGASRQQQQQQKQTSSPTDSIRNKLLRQRQQDQNTASTNV